MPLLDRRRFLKAAGAGFAVSLSPAAQAAVEQADAVFATAYQRRDGAYGVGVLSEAGELLFSTELPDRGHDVTFDPRSRRSVVFARRPGTFAVVFDHGGGQLPLTLTSPEGRHFFGHGLFSPDGKLLYATENDYDKAAGLIGVYDATDRFRRIGEFPTHGMDPHEVILMPDGKTLASPMAASRPTPTSAARTQRRHDEAIAGLRRPADRVAAGRARAGARFAPAVDPAHGRSTAAGTVVRLPVRRAARNLAAARRPGAPGESFSSSTCPRMR